MTDSVSPSTLNLRAGAAQLVITPAYPVFLWGYPRVSRTSTGVHDQLFCSALYLASGLGRALFLANDIIFVTKSIASTVRDRIGKRTGLAPHEILVSATHTHSGPMTVRYLSNENDPYVPDVDSAYVEFLVMRIVEAGCQAVISARPASIAFAVGDATGIGTNRHDPSGPSDLRVPCWLVRDASTGTNMALMAIAAMHPTVLHEDSTLISGDFPGLARAFLKKTGLLPYEAPFVYHTGASGNQSPRHVTRANTFEEAARLGAILGDAIIAAFDRPEWQDGITIATATQELDLDLRDFPDQEAAKRRLDQVEASYHHLVQSHAPRAAIRTAECDLFGAEETATLAHAAKDGRVSKYTATCLPAEIQAVQLGDRIVIAWPGEHFVEFALEVRRQLPDAEIITLANGELQGYIVTEAAARRGCYEAENALFAASNSGRFIAASFQLARQLERDTTNR